MGLAPPPLNPAPPGRAPPIPPPIEPPRPPRPCAEASSSGATNAIPKTATHPSDVVKGTVQPIIQCRGLFFISAHSILGNRQIVFEPVWYLGKPTPSFSH
jgi:hypothetical protein